MDLSVRVLRMVVLGLGAAVIALFLWVVAARFAYPIDAEWLVGSVRDAVIRLRDGKEMYAAPSAEFIPFLYTPAWHYLAAALSRILPVFVACKVVSLAATAGTAWGVYRVARQLDATRFWAVVSVLLHFGAYSLTLLFYDLERVDSLEAAFCVVGLALVLGGGAQATARDVAGGVVFGLAFFAKQPGLLAFGAAAFGLFFAGERRRAAIVLGAGAAAFALVFAVLELRTGGWFSYYCLKLPRAHGIEPRVVSTFFIVDLPKAFVLSAATVAILAPLVWAALKTRRPPAGWSWREVVFACVLAGGFFGAFFLRAHRGGWANVIVCWTPLGCIAAGVRATRAEARAKGTSAAQMVTLGLLGAVALQLAGGLFDPTEGSPDASDLEERQNLIALVRRLEAEGEVHVTPEGNVSRVMHLHTTALFDILRAGGRPPDDYMQNLRNRRYAALLTSRPFEYQCLQAGCRELTSIIHRHYFVAARLDERLRSGMTGHDARPRWILRPRRHVLPELAPDLLETRVRAEIGLALARRSAAAPGAPIQWDDSIEERAAHVDATRAATEGDPLPLERPDR